MYKDILKKIYRDVKNEKEKEKAENRKQKRKQEQEEKKNEKKIVKRKVSRRKKEEKNPRVLDYVKAVIKYEDKDFFKNNNEEDINKKIEQIRRSVAHALEVLKEEGVMGKIGNNYVPIEKALRHSSRLYLIEHLKPARGAVIRISDKVYTIPVRVEKKKVSENTCSDEGTFDLTTEVGRLQNEVMLLKKRVESLSRKRDKMDVFFENLQTFIGYEYCGSVFNIKNNLFIILDTDDEEEQKRIYDDLNILIRDIKKTRPKIPLVKKQNKK